MGRQRASYRDHRRTGPREGLRPAPPTWQEAVDQFLEWKARPGKRVSEFTKLHYARFAREWLIFVAAQTTDQAVDPKAIPVIAFDPVALCTPDADGFTPLGFLIEDYIDGLVSAGLKPRTVHVMAGVVRHLLRWMGGKYDQRVRWVSAVPEFTDLPDVEALDPRGLSMETALALFDRSAGVVKHPDEAAILALALATGARRKELARGCHAEVAETGGILTLRIPAHTAKSKRARVAPLHPEFRATIESYWARLAPRFTRPESSLVYRTLLRDEEQIHGPKAAPLRPGTDAVLFHQRAGMPDLYRLTWPVAEADITQVFRTIQTRAHKAGILGKTETIGDSRERVELHLSPHVARKTYCMLWLAKGAPTAAVRVWMGHTSLTQTGKYADMSPGQALATLGGNGHGPKAWEVLHEVDDAEPIEDLTNGDAAEIAADLEAERAA